MENRRQDYRHLFPASDRPGVDLNMPGMFLSLRGEIEDLSIGGMKVRLADSGSRLKLQERWQTSFTPTGQAGPMSLTAAVVHAHPEEPVFGMHFLPLVDPAANEARERALWVFLMDQQRRHHRPAPPARAG